MFVTWPQDFKAFRQQHLLGRIDNWAIARELVKS